MSADSRVRFYRPQGGLTEGVIMSVLSLVAAEIEDYPAREAVRSWTEMERLVVYDWAWRVHLKASDNPVHMRPRPDAILNGKGVER